MDSPLIGSIVMFAANFAPRGWAFCQGQLLPISQNAALFSILGVTYGGNGTTNFALPDLRGRFAVQQGTGPGLTPVSLGEMDGQSAVTLTSGQLPQHTHTAKVTINAAADGRAGGTSPAGSILDDGTAIYASAPDGTTMNAGSASATMGVSGGNSPVNIQNLYLGINYIIALQGVFPSRN